MAAKKRSAKSKRSRAINGNSRIGKAIKTIEEVGDLPRGSVTLVLPGGRKARSDSRIRNLRASWASQKAS